MAFPYVKMETVQPTIRLRDMVKDVEHFEMRLHQKIERTKKSIEQLSIDCKSYCSKVHQEADAFIENIRAKSLELCDQMNLKTKELQSKWGQFLQEKKNLLEDARKWLIDLNILLDKKEDGGYRVASIKAELSERIHESFTPVKEGHFVVTFPEWCQRSLDQLQKEIVDFTIETWPPRELELQNEFGLQDSNLEISSIAVSDENNYVFVYDKCDISFKRFGETGKVVSQCPLKDKGFLPWEICCLSKDNFVVCGPLWSESGLGGGLLFWEQISEKEEIIKASEKPFCSLCQMKKEIFVCDLDFNEILCFSQDGSQIKKIQLQNSPLSGFISDPLLRVDPTTGNLWGTRRGMSEMIVFDQNGQILQIVKTQEKILDFCADEFGQFYFCNKEGIFSILPEIVLYKFPKESEIFPRIFVLEKKFFVCFENDAENLMKIFKLKEKL